MTLAQRFEEIGVQKGIEQGKIDVARKMLSEGMDIATAAKLTDLPVDKVKQIKVH